MSLLCDWQITELCETSTLVTPFDPKMVQPCSLDVRLGSTYAEYLGDGRVVGGPVLDLIDPREPETYRVVKGKMFDSGFILMPGRFILAETMEVVNLPTDIAMKLDGRSSVGRLGILIHLTAGWIDPGFTGTITLEIFNANARPIVLYPGMVIGQLEIHKIKACKRGYGEKGGRYQSQSGATESRFWM